MLKASNSIVALAVQNRWLAKWMHVRRREKYLCKFRNEGKEVGT